MINFNELTDIFGNFLTKFTNNQWGYTFTALITFLIIIAVICNMLKNKKRR